jgi:transmembrane sensor
MPVLYNMENYKRQFERVWKEAMSVEEKKVLLESFLQDEKAWKASLEAEFRQDIAAGAIYLPAERSKYMLERLHAQLQVTTAAVAEDIMQPPVKRLSAVMKWAVAAAVLALCFTGYYLYQQAGRGQQEQPVVVAAASKLSLESNSGTINRDVLLEDGSVITLAPGSSVRYYHPFINARRDISLSGQAWFVVAKDAARPFTVYANDISTTALGTKFMVSTLVQNKVAVRLFEGKVVVRSATPEMPMNDVYLKPGEEFSVDRLLRQFIVKRFDDVHKSDSLPIAAVKVPKPDKNTIAALEFSQEPLPQVLLAIGKRYNVRFIYDDEAIRNELVTGRFLPSDSLETVLSILGTVNRLSFVKHQNSITVSIVH